MGVPGSGLEQGVFFWRGLGEWDIATRGFSGGLRKLLANQKGDGGVDERVRTWDGHGENEG